MNIIRDTCIDFFKNEDIKKDMKEMMTPIFNLIYNEIYIYIWIIAIYNIFFLFILLGMFFLLVRLLQQRESAHNTNIHRKFPNFLNDMLPEVLEGMLPEIYKKII
jgi:Flp pilus assembly protein TadB